MKKIISIALITAMVLSALMLAACGSSEEKDYSDSKYLGTWKIASIELQDESDDFDEDWTIELNADGTGKSNSEGETNEFTWEPTDDGFKTKGDLKLTFTDDGDKIVGDLFGVKLVFEKQE